MLNRGTLSRGKGMTYSKGVRSVESDFESPGPPLDPGDALLLERGTDALLLEQGATDKLLLEA